MPKKLGPNAIKDPGNGTLEIQLNQGQICLIDKTDYELVKNYRWYAWFSKTSKSFYVRGYSYNSDTRRNFPIHRLIMSPPPELEIDHINHETLDNRRQNLRIVTRKENQANRKVQPKSRGPRPLSEKANGKQHSTELAAVAARIIADKDVTMPVHALPLAKIMVQMTGCEISTAKRHIAKAVRRARHEYNDPEWGGARPGAGRPKKEV